MQCYKSYIYLLYLYIFMYIKIHLILSYIVIRSVFLIHMYMNMVIKYTDNQPDHEIN